MTENCDINEPKNRTKYMYDAINNRVRINQSGEDPEDFIFNPAGQHTSSYDPTGGWTDYGWVYWGSKPIVLYANQTMQFEHQDWLGTERMRTTYNGQAGGSYSSLPFGDGLTVNGNDWVPYHFAGLEQDIASSDHAVSREYAHTTGRWFSPDLYSGSYDFANPQSFNRYSYVTNNPLSFTDPSGQDIPGACLLGNPILCAAGTIASIFFGLDQLLGGPSFHGSLKPRPNSQPWDEHHIHYGPNIAGALGLPDAGCEFGACGGIPSDNFGPGVAVGATVVCQFVEPCGAIEDGLLVGGVLLTGAAAIWEMSQHGRGNVADTGIENEARQQFPNLDMCSALDLLMRAAKAAGDTKKQMRIKATQKAYGCRQSRG